MVAEDHRGARAPLMLRGSLFTLRRKFGKPGRDCATGDGHESPALACPVGGRTKTMTLAERDVATTARAALDRHRAAREELDGPADAGVAVLQARIAARRQRRRRIGPAPCWQRRGWPGSSGSAHGKSFCPESVSLMILWAASLNSRESR